MSIFSLCTYLYYSITPCKLLPCYSFSFQPFGLFNDFYDDDEEDYDDDFSDSKSDSILLSLRTKSTMCDFEYEVPLDCSHF